MSIFFSYAFSEFLLYVGVFQRHNFYINHGSYVHRVDCVGILKLRNADVEARIGVAGSKKKSTRARLAFRVNIPQSDGSALILQVPSSPILCSKSSGRGMR